MLILVISLGAILLNRTNVGKKRKKKKDLDKILLHLEIDDKGVISIL